MPTPGLDGLRFFLDRGLGSRLVPGALREAGWTLTTMDERYGTDQSQHISDEKWIAEATDLGEILLCKDTAIASNPPEARLIYMYEARAFALAKADLTGKAMIDVILMNEARIVRMASRAQGPYVAVVSRNGLRRRRLAYP